MDAITSIIGFVQTPAFGGVMAALWVMSEALAAIPAIKANSVFQMIQNFLERFKKDPA